MLLTSSLEVEKLPYKVLANASTHIQVANNNFLYRATNEPRLSSTPKNTSYLQTFTDLPLEGVLFKHSTFSLCLFDSLDYNVKYGGFKLKLDNIQLPEGIYQYKETKKIFWKQEKMFASYQQNTRLLDEEINYNFAFASDSFLLISKGNFNTKHGDKTYDKKVFEWSDFKLDVELKKLKGNNEAIELQNYPLILSFSNYPIGLPILVRDSNYNRFKYLPTCYIDGCHQILMPIVNNSW